MCCAYCEGPLALGWWCKSCRLTKDASARLLRYDQQMQKVMDELYGTGDAKFPWKTAILIVGVILGCLAAAYNTPDRPEAGHTIQQEGTQ